MGATAVADRLAAVRDRIARACARAGRPDDSVRLVAVSKRIPLPLVLDAVRAGQRDFGENRVQDALPRQDELAGALAGTGVTAADLAWHFIGHLQRNKARKVAGRFALVHGVDSLAAAERISRGCGPGAVQPLLLEVNISGEEQKDGVDPAALAEVAAAVAGLPALELRGLMGMARYGAGAAELSRSFGLLASLASRTATEIGRPLPELSMGMSGDFEAAISEGATIVRVGSALFGPRPA